ncbi:MAG: hypothetical protein RIC55_08060 [Pirellulaceae bacterium]
MTSRTYIITVRPPKWLPESDAIRFLRSLLKRLWRDAQVRVVECKSTGDEEGTDET